MAICEKFNHTKAISQNTPQCQQSLNAMQSHKSQICVLRFREQELRMDRECDSRQGLLQD